jgi:hypothetical protein
LSRALREALGGYPIEFDSNARSVRHMLHFLAHSLPENHIQVPAVSLWPGVCLDVVATDWEVAAQPEVSGYESLASRNANHPHFLQFREAC